MIDGRAAHLRSAAPEPGLHSWPRCGHEMQPGFLPRHSRRRSAQPCSAGGRSPRRPDALSFGRVTGPRCSAWGGTGSLACFTVVAETALSRSRAQRQTGCIRCSSRRVAAFTSRKVTCEAATCIGSARLAARSIAGVLRSNTCTGSTSVSPRPRGKPLWPGLAVSAAFVGRPSKLAILSDARRLPPFPHAATSRSPFPPIVPLKRSPMRKI